LPQNVLWRRVHNRTESALPGPPDIFEGKGCNALNWIRHGRASLQVKRPLSCSDGMSSTSKNNKGVEEQNHNDGRGALQRRSRVETWRARAKPDQAGDTDPRNWIGKWVRDLQLAPHVLWRRVHNGAGCELMPWRICRLYGVAALVIPQLCWGRLISSRGKDALNWIRHGHASLQVKRPLSCSDGMGSTSGKQER
jgi:hypothetical protein